MGGCLGEECEGEEDEEGDSVDRVVGSWMDRDMVKGLRLVTTNSPGSLPHPHEGPSDHSGAGDAGQVWQAGS